MRRAARPALLAGIVLLVLGPLGGAGTAAPARTVLNFGDSLALGTGLFLPSALTGWQVSQSFDISRHADAGPPGLRAYGSALPRVIVVSLGTNDDPTAVARFSSTVRDVLRVAGPDRCVVWSTIVRPPYEGISYVGYNRALRRIANEDPDLLLFDWGALAKRHPGWFARDGVHPTATGYRARAIALARLAKLCG